MEAGLTAMQPAVKTGAAAKKAANAVANRYKKMSLHEHILARPDSYVGTLEPDLTEQWIVNLETKAFERKKIRFVPALYKIFDEILVNAADNIQRDPTQSFISVDINRGGAEGDYISVQNDGHGIPIRLNEKERMFIPTLIFGNLLAGDNFNDSNKRCAGGRNGYGAKLCNIYSKKFIVETQVNGRYFKQVWEDNMFKTHPHTILEQSPGGKEYNNGKDFTRVTFWPDLKRFRKRTQKEDEGQIDDPMMTSLDDDIVGLMTRRVYDCAGTTPHGVSVWLNGSQLPIKTFEEYVRLYPIAEGHPLIHEKVSDRWEIFVTLSDKGFQQVSFVNSIATMKGGHHVSHVYQPLVEKVWTKAREESANLPAGGAFKIQLSNIKNQLSVFVNCLIENPTFDTQTKENMTSLPKDFGSECKLSEETVDGVLNCGIVDKILRWARMKQQAELAKRAKISTKSTTKLIIPKLEDANLAGTNSALDCTLILTEGDSAKATAMAGLGVVGRDYYGVFPLKGKILNVRNAKPKQIAENAEVQNLCKILGLQIPHNCLANDFKFAERPEEDFSDSTIENLKKTMRYGSVTIMTDQDFDGSHIKGLLLNVLNYFWPSLVRHEPGFVREFVTPIVKVSKKKEVISFFTVPEYEKWKSQVGSKEAKTWKIKYYKGLGTSTSKEAKEYFEKLERHSLTFVYTDDVDDDHVDMAFNNGRADDRKKWIQALDDDAFVDHNESELKIVDFVKKELVFMAHYDVIRSIPSVLDGFKPTQRKILHCCFKKKLKNDIKVAQLAGYISEKAAYHHGEVSLEGAIVSMAQDYVGSNNVKLLVPSGQFGTRLEGGSDRAASRYIYTRLNNPLSRAIFREEDDQVLEYLNEEGQWIEPKAFAPIIPMVLCNGATGIGTGWSTSIPNFNPRDIAENVRRWIGNQNLTETVTSPEDSPEASSPEEPPDESNAENGNLLGGAGVGGLLVRAGEKKAKKGEQDHTKKTPYLDMVPWYRNFEGLIRGKPGQKAFTSEGVATFSETDPNVVDITELPIGMWTQQYKEKLIKMVKENQTGVRVNNADNAGGGELQACGVEDFREYHTDVSVHFQVKLSDHGVSLCNEKGMLKFFGLTTQISTTNMMAFDRDGKIAKFDTPIDVVKEFCIFRAEMYRTRRNFQLEVLRQAETTLQNQRRFVQEVVAKRLVIKKRKIDAVLKDLDNMNFKHYSAIKEMVTLRQKGREDEEPSVAGAEKEEDADADGHKDEDEDEDEVEEDESDANPNATSGPAWRKKMKKNFEYLLNMPLSSLTNDRINDLENQYKAKVAERELLQNLSWTDIWLRDLEELDDKLTLEDKFYEKELAELMKQKPKVPGVVAMGGVAKSKAMKKLDKAQSKDKDQKLEKRGDQPKLALKDEEAAAKEAKVAAKEEKAAAKEEKVAAKEAKVAAKEEKAAAKEAKLAAKEEKAASKAAARNEKAAEKEAQHAEKLKAKEAKAAEKLAAKDAKNVNDFKGGKSSSSSSSKQSSKQSNNEVAQEEEDEEEDDLLADDTLPTKKRKKEEKAIEKPKSAKPSPKSSPRATQEDPPTAAASANQRPRVVPVGEKAKSAKASPVVAPVAVQKIEKPKAKSAKATPRVAPADKAPVPKKSADPQSAKPSPRVLPAVEAKAAPPEEKLQTAKGKGRSRGKAKSAASSAASSAKTTPVLAPASSSTSLNQSSSSASGENSAAAPPKAAAGAIQKSVSEPAPKANAKAAMKVSRRSSAPPPGPASPPPNAAPIARSPVEEFRQIVKKEMELNTKRRTRGTDREIEELKTQKQQLFQKYPDLFARLNPATIFGGGSAAGVPSPTPVATGSGMPSPMPPLGAPNVPVGARGSIQTAGSMQTARSSSATMQTARSGSARSSLSDVPANSGPASRRNSFTGTPQGSVPVANPPAVGSPVVPKAIPLAQVSPAVAQAPKAVPVVANAPLAKTSPPLKASAPAAAKASASGSSPRTQAPAGLAALMAQISPPSVPASSIQAQSSSNTQAAPPGARTRRKRTGSQQLDEEDAKKRKTDE